MGHPRYLKAEQPLAAALVPCRLAAQLGDSSSTRCHQVTHQHPGHTEERGWVMDGGRAVMGGGRQEQCYQYITLLGGKKSPLELYRALGSGSGAATAHTLREVPFLTDKNASVFPCPLPIACVSCWSCRGQAAGTRHWLWDVQRLQEPIKGDLFLAWAFPRS